MKATLMEGSIDGRQWSLYLPIASTLNIHQAALLVLLLLFFVFVFAMDGTVETMSRSGRSLRRGKQESADPSICPFLDTQSQTNDHRFVIQLCID